MKIIDKQIFRLAIPSIVSNITVPLLGLVDLSIVGHMGSERYIAAIAIGSMIFNVIYWLFGFLRMGTSGMASQALGRADYHSVRLLLRRSLYVSMAIAAFFLVTQIPLRWLSLAIIMPSPQISPLVISYFNIVIWGAPAMLGLYGLNGWFIGLQNTKIPMVVAIFQNVVNIAMSLFLVFAMHMRIEGVAWGTLVAQWSGFLLAAWFARDRLRRMTAVAPSATARVSPGVSWASFFVVNRDIFLRTICLVAVNLFFTTAGARQGDMMLAVNTLLMTFFTLFSYVMDGFAFAGEALAGRLYGAGDTMGLRLTTKHLLVIGAVMVGAFSLVYGLGGDVLLRLLTNDREVVRAAEPFFFWVCLVPAAGVAAFIYDGIFIGLTATRGMLLSSLVATILFFAIFFVGIWLYPSNHILWLAFIFYLFARGSLQHMLIRKYLKL